MTNSWIKLSGAAGGEFTFGITTGLDGAIYTGGSTNSPVLNGASNNGDHDAYLIKYGPDGTRLWTRLIGGNGYEIIHNLSRGWDGSIYAVGYSTSAAVNGSINSGDRDILFVKYQPDGSTALTKLLGGSGGDYGQDVCSGPDGFVYVTGYTTSSIFDGQRNQGERDVFLSKIHPDGNLAWTKTLGGTGSDWGVGVTAGRDGAIFVTGFTASPTFDGHTISGDRDGFITKFLPDGTKQWTKLIGGVGADETADLTIGFDGSIYAVGSTTSVNIAGQTNAGGRDAFVAKYLPDGVQGWVRLLGGGGVDWGQYVSTGADGSIYVSGYTQSSIIDGRSVVGDTDVFISKLGSNGSVAWTKLVGGNGAEYGAPLSAGLDGGSIFAAGYTSSSVLDGQTNNGQYDSFISKVDETITNALHGIAYDWKNHALLSDVRIVGAKTAISTGELDGLISFKNIRWERDGTGSLEVWTDSGNLENFDLEISLSGVVEKSFVHSLGGNWTVVTMSANDQLRASGYTYNPGSSRVEASGGIKIGDLFFRSENSSKINFNLDFGNLGSTIANPRALSLIRDLTGEYGQFLITPLQDYVLAERRTNDLGDAVNSADALAALKIAVGVNPNRDPDGDGPLLAPPVSPYQVIAANVIAGDGRITSADALAILKMALGMSTSATPEWLFVEETRDFYDEENARFLLDRTNVDWNREVGIPAPSGRLNLVGILQGDVDGSWRPPAGSVDLDALAPNYFTELSRLLGVPESQWVIH